MTLDKFHRQFIIDKFVQNNSVVEIQTLLANVLSKDVSKKSIRSVIRRYKETGSVESGQKGGNPSKLTRLHLAFIFFLSIVGWHTAPYVLAELQERFKLTVALKTVQGARERSGIRFKRRTCAPLITHVNQQLRWEFAESFLASGDHVDDMVFVDEASIYLDGHGHWCFVRRLPDGSWQKPPPYMMPKHPYKVHIWGGISRRGATPCYIFTENLNAGLYVRILRDILVPWGRRFYPGGFRLYQDNDPKHRSRIAQQFYEDNNICVYPTVAQSPDCNMIEQVWKSAKDFLHEHGQPRNKEELVRQLCFYWKYHLTVRQCNRYINRFHRNVNDVLVMQGRYTGN